MNARRVGGRILSRRCEKVGGLLLGDEILTFTSGPIRMGIVGGWNWPDPSRNEAMDSNSLR
jgi:hypothetical protein